MVSGLDQLPTFHTFLMEEILQPSNAALKGIMDKTLTILIAFDGTLLSLGLWLWQFMNRNLIFPLGHSFFLFLGSSNIHSWFQAN